MALSIHPNLEYTSLMDKNTPVLRTPLRSTFADWTGRAGKPMAFDGDFDDNFTAEDYDRRAYLRDARRYGTR